MCKFLKTIFGATGNTTVSSTDPQDNDGYTEPNDDTGGTDVVIDGGDYNPEPVITEPDNNNDDNNTTTMTDNQLEVQRKILDFAADMAKGKTRVVNQIAVHCTATAEGREVTMAEIDSWHKARGFSKQKISGHYCGYHFVVALDGTIMCGRDLRETGAHVSGYNSKSIGVCYVGGLDEKGKAKDTRTPEQKETLNWLIGELKHILDIKKVQGHRDYSPDKNGNGIIESFEWIKSCPCFDAIPEYKDL